MNHRFMTIVSGRAGYMAPPPVISQAAQQFFRHALELTSLLVDPPPYQCLAYNTYWYTYWGACPRVWLPADLV